MNEKKLHEKSTSKTIEILLTCEKSVEEITIFLPKRFKKNINEDQKSILINEMKLFDIRNTIATLFKNGFITSLDYRSTVKL